MKGPIMSKHRITRREAFGAGAAALPLMAASRTFSKDRKLHVDRGVPAGQGDPDYGKFVTLAAQ